VLGNDCRKGARSQFFGQNIKVNDWFIKGKVCALGTAVALSVFLFVKGLMAFAVELNLIKTD
jgi:hypothetical protein